MSILAFILGHNAKLVEPIALVPIATLFIIQTLLQGKVHGLLRFVFFIFAVAISIGLIIRFFPGFTGLPIVQHAQISQGAAPYSLYLNFSKLFTGISVLACGLPLVTRWEQFYHILKVTLPMAILGITLMILLALFSGLIQFDPKLPKIFWFFLIDNLIFVSIVEEAFWRGCIQRELFRMFGKKGGLANAGCIILTSLFFATLHWFWISSVPFLVLVFIAGAIYGSIYQYTQSLEASILTHWLFNLIHFSLFTYPVLQSAL